MMDRIWFTDKEIHDMKTEMNQIAAAIDLSMGENDKESRGLEHCTEEGNWKAY